MNAPRGEIAVVVVAHESALTLDDCLRRLRDSDDVAQIRIVLVGFYMLRS